MLQSLLNMLTKTLNYILYIYVAITFEPKKIIEYLQNRFGRIEGEFKFKRILTLVLMTATNNL